MSDQDKTRAGGGPPPGPSGAGNGARPVDDRGLPPGGSAAEGRRGVIDARQPHESTVVLPSGLGSPSPRRTMIGVAANRAVDDRGLPPGGSAAEGRRGLIDGSVVLGGAGAPQRDPKPPSTLP